MPSRLCSGYPACNKTIPTEDRYCGPCGKKYSREREQRPDRKQRKAYYNSDQHKNLRVETLARDPFCRCRADYCSHPKPCGLVSTICDHVIPRERGGADDLTNTQGLCKPCHDLKTNLVDKGIRGSIEATLVCGPPGCGKSTYVQEQFKPGHVLVDFEQFMRCMTGLKHVFPDALKPLGWEAMDAALDRIATLEGKQTVWITACAPRRAQRDKLQRGFKAKVIVLEVSEAECLRRISGDKTRSPGVDWKRLVQTWWHEYERNHGDERRVS